MDTLYTIAITLLTLGILVTVHEYGHFWVARRCGVKVLRFSIGFGTPLLTWRDSSGTEYCIAAIPLGGYVKMLDEREGEVEAQDLKFTFNNQPVLARIAIVSAGPIANFILAIAAYYFVFITGITGLAPIIDAVEANSIAERAGLESGQEIVQVDGTETPTWQVLNMQLLKRLGESGVIRFAAKYPGSDIVYESEARLDRWLINDEAPDLLKGIGITAYRPKIDAVIDDVLEDSPAAHAGLKTGDRILESNGQLIEDWQQWVEIVQAQPGQPLDVRVARGEENLTLTVVPKLQSVDGKQVGQVGVMVKIPEWPDHMLRTYQYSAFTAIWPAIKRTGQISLFTLDSLKKMLMGLISPKNLSGPITIAKVASSYAKSGFESYLGFLALLSISLGVLNLLPIPVLDGGHLLFYGIELVKGSPVPEKIQILGYQLGLTFILGVMCFALYNDISRL